MASAERIFQLLDTKSEILEKAHPEIISQPKGLLEFKNIHFFL